MGSLVIATNTSALNSHRALKVVSERTEKSSEKLSSGYKINRAADDASGLAISEKMRNQIKGLNKASTNAADGISLIQTAEGALQETHEMLKRMRELVVQGANDTNVSLDRAKIGGELYQLMCEIDSTASKTEYNKKKLIDGSLSGATKKIFLQVGANSNQNIQFNISGMSTKAIGLTGTKTVDGKSVSLYSSAACTKAVSGDWSTMRSQIDTAISAVSVQRANLGALQNRLEHTIKTLDIASENLSSAESRIRDTDMAKEMMEYTKTNILTQAGMSMLSQANNSPNNVLSLIQ